MAFAIDYARTRLRKLDEQITAEIERAANGSAQTDASYRELVGFIKGLRAARALFIEPFDARDRADISHNL